MKLKGISKLVWAVVVIIVLISIFMLMGRGGY